MSVQDKFISSKCRELLKGYGEVFEILLLEIESEINGGKISGNSSFEYAKEVIRRQGISEGARLFLRKMNSKANVRE